MKVKISMLLFVFALFSGALMAQTKVTGTVTGSDGMPLPGVSVVIKGTTRGVSTDFDGKYEIQANHQIYDSLLNSSGDGPSFCKI